MDIKDIQVGKKYRYSIPAAGGGIAETGVMLVETTDADHWPIKGYVWVDNYNSEGPFGNLFAHEVIEEVV